jgi:polysaccharide deacetylase 2 family uncharacterized protein YibQ
MPARRSSKRSKNRGLPGGLVLIGAVAALVAAAYFAGPRLLSLLSRARPGPAPPAAIRDSGDRLRAALGDPADPASARRVLARAIRDALLAAGIGEEDIREKDARGPDGLPEWEVAVPARASLVRLNLAITRGVRRAGGEVLDAYFEQTRKTQGVWIVAGTASQALHRVFLRPARTGDEEEPEPGPRRIAIVIDDSGGRERVPVERFLTLGVPLTIAFLPGGVEARPAAERAREAGAAILLHLPLEPKGYPRTDPGRDAILVDLKEGEIRRRIGRHLDSLPPVDGVSSYMGSLATQDRRTMGIVLEEIRRRGLFFLDSRTSMDTVAPEEALRLGVPCLVNHVFLDAAGESDGEIQERFDEAAKRAASRGSAIVMGRARAGTLAAVEKAVPRLRRKGFEFVTVSSLLGEREGERP